MIRLAASATSALAALTLALCVGPSTASAQLSPVASPPAADPGWWGRQTPIAREVINDWAYRPSGNPPPYDIMKDDPERMFRQEMDELGERRNAQRYQASKLRSAAGITRAAGTALSRFSLIAGTFAAGYAIGTEGKRLVGEITHGGPASAGSNVTGQAMEFYTGTAVPFGGSPITRIDELPGVPKGEGAYIFNYTNPGGIHSAARPQAPSSHWVNAPPADMRRYSFNAAGEPDGYEKRIVGYRTVEDTIPRVFSSAPGTHPRTANYPSIEPLPLSQAGTTRETRSDRLGQELEKAENQDLRRMAEAQTGQDGAVDPYEANSTVPAYGGYVWESYRTRLVELGFTDINRIIVPDSGANLELGANAVVNTSPVPGSNVGKDSRINVETNPATLPLVVPTPRVNETYSQYLERLDPKLRERVQEDVATDPDLNAGPDVVLSTDPAPGAQVRPESDPAFRLRVRRNPSTAPVPGGAGGSCGLTPPSPAINLSPITNAKLGSKIPFSLVGFLGGAGDGLVTASARPNAGFSVLGVSSDLSMLGDLDPAIGAFRLALAFLLWLGVGWFLYGRTIGRDT